MGWLRAIKKKKNPQAAELSQLKEELRRLSEKLESHEGELAEANASIAERTGPSPPSGATSPSLTAGCACWESLPWRTRSSNRRHARSWNVFTNKTFGGSVTAFVPDVAVTKPWMPCLWVSAGAR